MIDNWGTAYCLNKTYAKLNNQLCYNIYYDHLFLNCI